jgi:hypothetical protein
VPRMLTLTVAKPKNPAISADGSLGASQITGSASHSPASEPSPIGSPGLDGS